MSRQQTVYILQQWNKDSYEFRADAACRIPTEAPHQPLSPSFSVAPDQPTTTIRSMTDGSPKGEGDRNGAFQSYK